MIGLNPVYCFFVLYLISHRTWQSFLLAGLGTAVGAASLQVVGLYFSRIRSAWELGRDRRLDLGELRPVIIGSLKGVIAKELWVDLASARVENSPLWKGTPNAEGNEVYIFVYEPRSPDAPWTPGSAFLGSVGQRVAIVRDDPLTAVRPWSRFLLLHELAHVSSEGVGLQIARWRMLLTMLHAIITVLVLDAAPKHVAISGLLLFAVASGVGTFLVFERLCESYADATAFRLLPSDQERKRVIELMRVEVEGAVKGLGARHFHTKLWRRRLASLLGPRRASVFNRRGGTIYDPSPISFLLASVATSILAWHSASPSSLQFWVYAIWCLCCQLGAIAMLQWARWTDAGVRISLHKRIK